MSLFEFADWVTCGVGSSVTWEDESFTRRRLDLPEMTAEQLEILLSTVPAEQRELFRKGEMSFEMRSRHHAVLVERHADRVVVEITTKTTGPGVNQEVTMREVIPAVPPPEPTLLKVSRWEDEDGSGSAVVVKQSFEDLFRGASVTEGDETLEIAGRPMACRWTERATDTPRGRFQLKTWSCAEIPGGVARESSRMEGPMDHQTVETTVVAFERKAP